MLVFLWLTLAAVAWGALYLGSCAIHPYTRCGACGGSGESRSSSFRGAFGPCRRCKGTRSVTRAGARLLGRKR